MTLFGLTSGYLIGMAVWCLALCIGLFQLLKLRRSGKTRPVRKKLANAGLSLWLLCVMLTGVELGFALGYDRTDSFNMSNVSRKWFRRYAQPEEKTLMFGTVRGITFRDNKPFPKPIPEDVSHICFLGDSFTYGHGINYSSERFSNLVGEKLNDDSPGKFVVTNLGRPGTDLYYGEGVLINMFDDDIRVDTAVYTLCLNDIESFHPDFHTYYAGDWTAGSNFFLFRDTYFLNLLYFRIQQARRPQVRNYYDFVREYYNGEPWELMQQKMIEIHRLCQTHDCEFRLVIFPFMNHLSDDNPFAAVHDQLVEFCQSEGIPVLDLLPVLAPHAEEGLVVSRFDAHPNELANRYAADAIYHWLAESQKTDKPETNQPE